MVVVMNSYRIAVVGAGSVGLGLASFLAQKSSVCLVARPSTVAALRIHGLVRDGIFGAATIAAGDLTVATEPKAVRAFISEADFTLICTKTFDASETASALAATGALDSSQSPLVLCHNGWGTHDAFARFFAPERIYNARVITGFKRTEPNHVTVTVHAQPISIGSLSGGSLAAVSPLAAALTAGGLNTITTETIGKDIWAKMLYNCALNPLGAILRLPYGSLAAAEPSRALMDGIIAEVFGVMSAAGMDTHWLSADGFLDEFYKVLVPATAAHESSMLQDIRGGRRTEIAALNGVIVKLGHAHGIPTPYNQTMVHLIDSLERNGARPPAEGETTHDSSVKRNGTADADGGSGLLRLPRVRCV